MGAGSSSSTGVKKPTPKPVVIKMLGDKITPEQKRRRTAIMDRRQYWLQIIFEADGFHTGVTPRAMRLAGKHIHNGVAYADHTGGAFIRITDPGGWNIPLPWIVSDDPGGYFISNFMNTYKFEDPQDDTKTLVMNQVATINGELSSKWNLVVTIHDMWVDVSKMLEYLLTYTFRDSKLTEVLLPFVPFHFAQSLMKLAYIPSDTNTVLTRNIIDSSTVPSHPSRHYSDVVIAYRDIPDGKYGPLLGADRTGGGRSDDDKRDDSHHNPLPLLVINFITGARVAPPAPPGPVRAIAPAAPPGIGDYTHPARVG